MDLDEQIELFKSSLKKLKNLDDLSKSLIFINIGQNDMDLNKRLSSNGSLDMGKYLAEPLAKRLQVNIIKLKDINQPNLDNAKLIILT
jgi:hypothetical protein